MSVAFRSKPLISSDLSQPHSSSPTPEPVHPEVEAPERAELAREAPEVRPGAYPEAPDAGDGRAGLMEHEFTHGRSQS